MGTILKAATCGAAAWRCRHTEPTVEAHARACDTRGVNDEQRPRGSAAALEPAAPALEPAALADPPASRPQPGTPGHVNEGAAPASSIAQRTLAWTREFIQFGLVGATAFIVDMGLFNLPNTGRSASSSATPTPRNSSQPRPPRSTRGSPTACGPTAVVPKTTPPVKPSSSSLPTSAASPSPSSACCSRTTSWDSPRRWPTTSPSTSSDLCLAPHSDSSFITTWSSPDVRARRFDARR